jgi:hypothetical protein
MLFNGCINFRRFRLFNVNDRPVQRQRNKAISSQQNHPSNENNERTKNQNKELKELEVELK